MSALKSEIIELPALTHPDAWDDPVLFDEVETPEISATLLPEPLSNFAAAPLPMRLKRLNHCL